MPRYLRFHLLAIWLVATLAPAATCQAAPDPVKLGFFASLTGREAAFGERTRRGVELAVEEINAAGGVLGAPLLLAVEDTRSLPGEAATAVKKLIARDKAVAVVNGTGSAAALEAAPVCQALGVPFVVATATNPHVTEAGDFVFRACFTDPYQGAVLARFARQTLGAARVGVLVAGDNAYSVGLAKFFRTRFVADGGEVFEAKYIEGAKDFRAQLTALKARRPDVIFASGNYLESALIATQARQLGLDVPLLGGDTWDTPALVALAGGAVEGSCFTGHFSPESDDPRARDFVRRFRARWGEAPDTGGSLGYEAVMLWADAVVRAGTLAKPAVRDALAATKGFAGVTGRITIDAQRNAAKPAVIFTVRDGKFVYRESASAGDAP